MPLSQEQIEERLQIMAAEERVSEMLFHHIGLLNATRSCKELKPEDAAAIRKHALTSIANLLVDDQ